MTIAHARIIAGLLSVDAITALKVMRKVVPAQNISVAGIDELVEKGLGRHEVNLIGGANIFLITRDGQKVADQVAKQKF